MEKRIIEWKKSHESDWKMIHGKLPISVLEYKFIMAELLSNGYLDLVQELEKRKEDLLQSK